ncbi:MAG: hypothetical protein U9R60_02440 [Bacteroidota bacterium]|nr:hypothetical protein [Bacteroidota bacterium]
MKKIFIILIVGTVLLASHLYAEPKWVAIDAQLDKKVAQVEPKVTAQMEQAAMDIVTAQGFITLKEAQNITRRSSQGKELINGLIKKKKLISRAERYRELYPPAEPKHL